MNAFSLTIHNVETGAQVRFENDSMFCNYRDKIEAKAENLGGTVIQKFEIFFYTSKSYEELLLFISFLRNSGFSITTDKGKTTIFWVQKTSLIKEKWDDILKLAKRYGVKSTSNSFDFDSYSKAKSFMASIFVIC